MQVVNRVAVRDAAVGGERGNQVEHRKGVAQASVGFLGDELQGFFLGLDAFLGRDARQVPTHVVHPDAVEVENLAPRQNGGDDFVLLGGGEYENGVGRRLFQRFQECVESRV